MPGESHAAQAVDTVGHALDPERVRNFAGLAVARVGPRAFEAVHGTFLALLVGARTGSAFWAAFALTAHRLLLWLIYPVVGRLSDATRSRMGRRAPFLGGGLLVMGAATWAYTLVEGYWVLVGLIVLARIANTTRQLTGAVAVPETFGRSRLLQAIIAIAVAGALVSLSVRITVIATWDEADPDTWGTSFRLAAAFMIAAGVAVLVLVRDGSAARQLATQPVEQRSWRERLGEVLEVPNARILLAAVFLSVAASGATGRLLPLFNREELGAGGAEQSAAILVAAALGLLISVPGAVVLLRLFSRVQLAVLGPLAAAAAAGAHFFVTDLWQSVAVGVLSGAVGLASFLALLPLLLQLLPRSGGMGERFGLALGPIALVGVSATYLSALTVDLVGSYRVMWVFPLVLGVVQAAVMTRLRLPVWAQQPDLRLRLRVRAGARGRHGRSGLFTGHVDVDDVDPTVLFEVARRAFGDPYRPPRRRFPVEPEPAATARRVLEMGRAATPEEVATAVRLLDDDATMVDGDERVEGQAGIVEHLCGPDWELHPSQAWRLRSLEPGAATFELVPVESSGAVEVTVSVSATGRVTHIVRRLRPTLAQRADNHVEQLGSPVPVPLSLQRPAWRHRWDRTVVTHGAIVRHLGGILLRRSLGRPTPPAMVARGLHRAFERLGAGYAKFGQIMASSPSLVGEEVADELRGTLDSGPVEPIRRIRATIQSELGRPLRELFSELDPEPIGRASIAVVHRAVTAQGRPVAVKVIRPGVERTMATDLALLEPLLRVASSAAGPAVTGPLLALLDGFRRQVAEELDLSNERRAMHHHRALLARMDLPDVVIPEPIDELSSTRVLTMELLDGVAVDDPAALDGLAVDGASLIEQVVKAWFTAAVRFATFHGDVHAGNLMVLRDGRIAMIDWGIVGRLDPGAHRFLCNLLAGALGEQQAWDEIGDQLIELLGPGVASNGLDRDQLLGLIRPRVEHLLTRPFGEVSLGALLADVQRAAAEGRAERRGRGRPGPPPAPPPLNRGVFLLAKQLLYFERYGRMHLGEMALLEDRAFFEQLLAKPQASPVRPVQSASPSGSATTEPPSSAER